MTTTSLTLSSVTTLPASRTQVGGIGVLQSQLTRYEKQLADWCACPSGKTAEGKRVIAGLETQAALLPLAVIAQRLAGIEAHLQRSRASVVT